jgi:hypothetical protein
MLNQDELIEYSKLYLKQKGFRKKISAGRKISASLLLSFIFRGVLIVKRIIMYVLVFS